MTMVNRKELLPLLQHTDIPLAERDLSTSTAAA